MKKLEEREEPHLWLHHGNTIYSIDARITEALFDLEEEYAEMVDADALLDRGEEMQEAIRLLGAARIYIRENL